MGLTDIKSRVQIDQLFTKISRNASATIQGTKTTGFDGQAFCVDVGTYTSGTGFTVTFQHRDGSEAWADIPHNQLQTSETLTSSGISLVEADEDTQIYVGYTGIKEEIGAVLTRVGDGVMVFGVVTVKGSPTQFPKNV
jgi:hypothetical protein